MGNRAVITFTAAQSAPCIYLHWNGGRASVQAFLKAARHLNLNAPLDGSSGINFDAQAQVLDDIANMIRDDFGMSSVYRETFGSSDTDNGVYTIGNQLDIVGRLYFSGREEINAKKTQEIYSAIITAREAA